MLSYGICYIDFIIKAHYLNQVTDWQKFTDYTNRLDGLPCNLNFKSNQDRLTALKNALSPQ